MKQVFLIHSGKAEIPAPLKKLRDSPSKGFTFPNAIQQHVILCDSETGKVHRATEIVSNPDDCKHPNRTVAGPFNERSLVYFESRFGKHNPNDVLFQIQKLDDAAKARVEAAYQQRYGQHL